MTETFLVVRLKHKKPLPTAMPVTDVVAQRLYTWLMNGGCYAQVSVALAKLEGSDAAR